MTDWFRIITELEQHLSLRAIAKQLGRHPSSVWRYKGDTEPRHGDGEKLLELHRRYVLNR